LVAHAKGDLDDALELAERALALFAQLDDVRAASRLQVAFGWLLLKSDPPQAAEAQSILRIAHDRLLNEGSSTDIAGVETELAVAALLLGDLDEALELVEGAYARYGDKVTLDSAGTMLVRGRILLAAGRREEAEEQYRKGAEALSGMHLTRQSAEAWREVADAYARLGRHEEASSMYQRALADLGVHSVPGTNARYPAAALD
jgi:tetratricopeptide (TPR) repeat protein